MIRYEDILKRISTIEKKKTRNEERIKVLSEENITLSSNLKLLNQKKELLGKMEIDLNNIFGTSVKSVDRKLSTDVASNVFGYPKDKYLGNIPKTLGYLNEIAFSNGGKQMSNTFILCFGCFVCGGFVGMMTLLFMQGAFYNENAKENETICDSIK